MQFIELYEKHRPRTFDEVMGQDKVVAQLRGVLARSGAGGRKFWISGASGTGKTTLARIVAATIADDWMIREYDAGDELGSADLDDIDRTMHLCGTGKGGRAFIINEAHGLRGPILRRLLGLLERVPPHVVFVFTTTKDGQDALFADDIDAAPLLSRCIRVPLTNQGLARPFAERALAIAGAEGLGGASIEAAIKLVQRCKNNLRAVLQEVEGGALLGKVAEAVAA